MPLRGMAGEGPVSSGGNPDGVPKVIKQLTYAVEVEVGLAEDKERARRWRHIHCYKHNQGKLFERPPFLPDDLPADIPTMIRHSAHMHADRLCMGTRTIEREVVQNGKTYWYKGPYQWSIYKDMIRDAVNGAIGLLAMDQVMELKAMGQCTAAILAETSNEWNMSAQIAWQAGMPITTVYTSLGHTAMVHALNETESPVLFMDWVQFPLLERNVLCKCPALKHIVLIGQIFTPVEVIGGVKQHFPSNREATTMQRDCTAMVKTLSGLMDLGKTMWGGSMNLETMGPKEDDHACIMYTSGSTGTPKGVLLSHKNFLSAFAGMMADESISAQKEEKLIAYMPLAHILELTAETGMLAIGAQIGYASPKTLTSSSTHIHKDNPQSSDLIMLQPNIMGAVPAVLEVIKNGLLGKLQAVPGFKGKLIRTAVDHAQGKKGDDGLLATMLSKAGLKGVLLKKLKKQMGLSSLRTIWCGGAALAPDTQRIVSAVLVPVLTAYGCTESCCLCTTTQTAWGGRPADTSVSRVGTVLPSVEIMLKSRLDMGYSVMASPPAGEILLGGPQVSSLGYFKRKELTERDFPCHLDGQRWFHTGDVGCLMPDGVFVIIDRIKDLIKLSHGEYVALGKVEVGLKQVPGIAQCVVFAKSDMDHCVAIVSQPEKGWEFVGGRPDEDALLQQITTVLQDQRFVSFEIPTKVKVDDLIWTPASGLTTPSLKVQRNKIREHYNQPGGLLHEMGYRFPES